MPGKNILVVDDESVFRRLISNLLEAQGHRTKVAQGPEQALAFISEFRPDILVTDYLLKDQTNGCDLANEIQTRLPNIKVIIVTGLPNLKINNKNFIQILNKPFRSHQLLNLIDKICQEESTKQIYLPLERNKNRELSSVMQNQVGKSPTVSQHDA